MIKDNTASSYSNSLWNKFYIPNDNITKRFKEVLNNYESLPANFYLDKDIPESYGLPMLELKKENIKPIKQIPLLSKLANGDYQTEESKSDYKIVKDIKFITNNYHHSKNINKQMIYHILSIIIDYYY